jgi:hypothetical protein
MQGKKKKIHSHSSSKGTEWMQGKNKDECISIHPFHLEMCLLLFQKKNALLPYIIHNTYMRHVLKGGTKLVTKRTVSAFRSSIFLLL